jgi:CHRD domain
MKSLTALLGIVALCLLVAPAAPQPDEGAPPAVVFQAVLTGSQETPAILSTVRGSFLVEVSASSLAYELSYDAFPTLVMVAHIHIGQRNVAGGIAVFLCGGGGKPDCPSPAGTVTGTITADDVMALPAQELEAGNFSKLLQAMQEGLTYANVHTMAHPGGEIRGQLQPFKGQGHAEE